MASVVKGVKKKPPRPKRVSSAKPDTVNRPEDEELRTANGLGDFNNSPTHEYILNDRVSPSRTMGSSSSINHEQRPTNGIYVHRSNNLLTLSHAQASNEVQTHDGLPDNTHLPLNPASVHDKSGKQGDKEFAMVQRSPIKSLHFKHSTFKGSSMSALTRQSIEKPVLSSLFPQKGKYKFTNPASDCAQTTTEDQNFQKSPTIRFGSTHLHQSKSPDVLFTSTPLEGSTKYDSNKAALTYGTLRKTNTSGSSGSVTEIFQKSKSKVRNSLRNWKFYTRNLSTEDKPAAAISELSNNITEQRNEFYNVTLTRPDDFEEIPQDWLSLSYDSATLLNQKARLPSKTALPVKIPTINNRLREEIKITRPIGMVTLEKKHTENKNSDGHQEQVTTKSTSPVGKFTKLDPEISGFAHGSESSFKTAEQESIAMLDSVIKSHSQFQYSRNVSINSDPSHQDISLMKSNNNEVPDPSQKEIKSPEQNNLCNNQMATLSHEKERQESLLGGKKANPRKENELFHGLKTVVEPLPVISGHVQVTNGLYSPSVGTVSLQSVNVTPTATPLPPLQVSSVVTPGMSISDVLAQDPILELEGKTVSSSGSFTQFNASFNSQGSANFEMNSYDDSSASFTESRCFDESEDGKEIQPCGGTIRKSGWLTVKHLLMHKRGKLEKPTKRKWQKFWVNLKGDHLLFYEIDETVIPDDSDNPSLIILLDGALIQAMPEHATRSNVLCLSTAQGSLYLMQSNSQAEIDGWIQAVHIEAATTFAGQKTGDQENITKKFIQVCLHKEIKQMKHEIEEDEKMRKMAELQTSLVKDAKSHRTITEQIMKWERNAEKNQVHVFRLRCYLASLEAAEQPNPRAAIAAACRSSKQTLSALKLLNITALHSLVVSNQHQNTTTTKKRPFNLNIKRSGSFSEVTKDRSPSGTGSIFKPKKSTLLGSLRGFDTWRGSTSSSNRKKSTRTSVGAIFSAFTSSSGSQSSAKNSEEKPKTPYSGRKNTNWPILPPPSGKYFSTNSTGDLPETPSDDDALDGLDSIGGSLDSLLLPPPDAWCMPVEYESSTVRVAIPTGEYVTVTMTENMTIRQLLEIVCRRKQLDSSIYYIIIEEYDSVVKFPKNDDLLCDVRDKSLKVKRKRQYSIEIDADVDHFGFTIRRPKLLCHPLIIDEISIGGVAKQYGLQKGEEIIIINGKLATEINDDDVEKALATDHLRLLVQTCWYEDDSNSKTWWPDVVDQTSKFVDDSSSDISEEGRERYRMGHLMAVMEEYLEKMVVPPPPVISRIQPPFIRFPFSAPSVKTNVGKRHDSIEDIVSLLVIPSPDHQLDSVKVAVDQIDGLKYEMKENQCNEVIDELLRKAEAVTKMCREIRSLSVPSLNYDLSESSSGNSDLPHHLSDLEKIWKVLHELVDTESNYVKDLDCLLKRFLEPLHSEGFLARLEMESLLQSVENILIFQQTFLFNLGQSIPEAKDASDALTLNRSLHSVTSSFLQHAAQFKLYAVFSTCHTVAQDLIQQTKSTSSEIRTFLDARNPKQQHSLSLDSYLIKPIQRVLKYPLLLRELLTLSESLEVVDTKARRMLKAALHAMHAVARHINDSQTVHDEFGSQGFLEVMEQASLKAFASPELIPSLSLSDLLCYCTSEWQNPPDEVTSKIKKGNILEMLVFVFRTAVVLLSRPTKQRDKKKVASSQQETALPYTKASSSDFIYSDVLTGSQMFVTGKCQGEKNKLQLSDVLGGEVKMYELLCNSTESKQRILKTARYVIRDSERKAAQYEAEDENTSFSLPETPEKGSAEEEAVSNPESLEVISRSSSPLVSKSMGGNMKQKNFFYTPTKENENPSKNTQPAVNEMKDAKFPLTIPLPTYEAAMQSVSESAKLERIYRARSTNLTPVQSSEIPKSKKRLSGLLISSIPTSPRSLPTSGFKSAPKTYESGSFNHDCCHGNVKAEKASNHTSGTDALSRGKQYHSDQLSGDLDVAKVPETDRESEHRNSAVQKYSKHCSPSRYNMVYGVAPYESKL